MKIFSRQFRILPILVLVVLLSFSVRLTEALTHFSNLSGGADARTVQIQSWMKGARLQDINPAAGEEDKKPDAPAPDVKSDKPVEENKVENKGEAAEPVAAGQAGGDAHQGDAGASAPSSSSSSAGESASVEGAGAGAPRIDVPAWRDPGDVDPGYAAVRREVYDELLARRQALEAQEKEIMTREALFKAAEKELDRKYDELINLRTELETLLGKQSDEEKARIASLVKIYENMKPKDAARIFDTLDLDVLVAVMGQMSERKMSPILAAMNDERARTVTIILAEQKQLPSLPEVN